MGSDFRGLPQSVMGWVRPVMAAHDTQMTLYQRKVHRFFGCDLQPIRNEITRLIGTEPACDVECEVNGVQFDVGQRVNKRDAVRQRLSAPALGHLVGGDQIGFAGPRRALWHVGIKDMAQPPQSPVPRYSARCHGFGFGVGGKQCTANGRSNGYHDHSRAALTR